MYSYHRTDNVTGQTLTNYEDKCSSQEAIILAYFRTYEAQVSPSKLMSVLFHDRTPITSVRRALSNLVRDKCLVKTEYQVRGPYNRSEHIWKLAPDQREMQI